MSLNSRLESNKEEEDDCIAFGVQDSWVEGLGFRTVEFRDWCVGPNGSGFRAWGLGLRLQDATSTPD